MATRFQRARSASIGFPCASPLDPSQTSSQLQLHPQISFPFCSAAKLAPSSCTTLGPPIPTQCQMLGQGARCPLLRTTFAHDPVLAGPTRPEMGPVVPNRQCHHRVLKVVTPSSPAYSPAALLLMTAPIAMQWHPTVHHVFPTANACS